MKSTKYLFLFRAFWLSILLGLSLVSVAQIDKHATKQTKALYRFLKNTSKALQGHFAKAGTTPKQKSVEFRNYPLDKKLGEEVVLTEIFTEGEKVSAIGTSKGKGFQGVVKRYHFAGVGQSTHGQHNRLRAPGSVGASAWPSRVFKGLRMAGRMGNERVKTKNLKIVKLLPEANLILIQGSVPGHKGSFVIIEK